MTGGPQINAEKVTILINSKVSLNDQIWVFNSWATIAKEAMFTDVN